MAEHCEGCNVPNICPGLTAPAVTESHGRPFYYECNVTGCTLDGHHPPTPAVTETADLRAALDTYNAGYHSGRRAVLMALREEARNTDGIAHGPCVDLVDIERALESALAGTSDTEEET